MNEWLVLIFWWKLHCTWVKAETPKERAPFVMTIFTYHESRTFSSMSCRSICFTIYRKEKCPVWRTCLGILCLSSSRKQESFQIKTLIEKLLSKGHRQMKEQTRWPCSRELVLWKADPALSPKGEQEEIMTLRFGEVWGCAQGASQWKLWLRTNVQSASTNRGPKQGVCMEGALAVSPCQPCLPLTKPI